MRKKKPKKKIELVFDPKKRREYLTGFRKRKQERREKAKKKLEQDVKEERKKIKQQIKEGFRDQLKKSYAPIPELEEFNIQEEYETEDVHVKIVELSTSELAEENNWIGPNRPIYSGDESEPENPSDNEKPIVQAVPGMGLTTDIKNNRINSKVDEKPKKNLKDSKPINSNAFKSKKAMGNTIAKSTMKTLKKSKAFQMKTKLESVKAKKKARIANEQKNKLRNKLQKRRGDKAKNKGSKRNVDHKKSRSKKRK